MNKYILFIFFFICFRAEAQVDVLHYKYELELTDRSDAITGKATITVRFLQPATQVQFDLATVDNDKGMYAFEVMEGTHALRVHHSNDVLSIELDKPAAANEEHTFVISYMGTPKDGLIISKNKYGDRTFFADNWPNRAHNWIPCIDRPDDKATFEFIVTAPAAYQVISNGVRTEEKMIDADRKRTHWEERVALPSKVMVIGVAKFAVKQFADSPPSIPVSAWVYPQDSTKGFYDYGVAPRILKFFSDYIAPYPYEKLANVQSKTIFGGMENASAIFYAEKSVTGNRKWEDVLAHEIAHQWFGDMASEKSFAHLWLSEGFATYFTDIYYQYQYGDSAFYERLKKERSEALDFAKKTTHAVVDSTADLMSLLNANSYQKGGWVLHMLRSEMGNSAFHQAIRAYYQKYKGGNAETRDLQHIAQSFTQRDLSTFFDQWLYHPGVPVLKISAKRSGDKVSVEVVQEQSTPFVFTLTVAFPDDLGTAILQPITITGKKTSVAFSLPANVREVQVDPKVQLLYDGPDKITIQ